MYPSSAFRAIPAKSGLTQHARITLAYPAVAGKMPLARLSRHGLVFNLRGPLELPPLGLPRPAAIFGGHELLCELRLVARGIERDGDGNLTLTVQPSRADDHETFWQALRHYHQRRLAGAHALAARHPAAGRELPNPRHARLRVLGGAAGFAPRTDEAGSGGALDARTRHVATFTAEQRDDARFVAEWLEYHLAEIEAHAQRASPFVRLRQLDAWSSGQDAHVQFGYEAADPATQACTERACLWVEAELSARFGIAVEYGLARMSRR